MAIITFCPVGFRILPHDIFRRLITRAHIHYFLYSWNFACKHFAFVRLNSLPPLIPPTQSRIRKYSPPVRELHYCLDIFFFSRSIVSTLPRRLDFKNRQRDSVVQHLLLINVPSFRQFLINFNVSSIFFFFLTDVFFFLLEYGLK